VYFVLVEILNEHFDVYGLNQQPLIHTPIISKRLELDFAFYDIPVESGINKGSHFIYLSENNKSITGIAIKTSLKQFVRAYNL
jgi:hypothetical protein